MEFTVIGEAVNAAWRLQEHTKDSGTDILLGGSVIDLIGDELACETLGELPLKGQGSCLYGKPRGSVARESTLVFAGSGSEF